MRYVFCTASCAMSFDGMVRHLHRGEVWLADDPLVKKNPQYFSDEAPIVHYSGAERPGVVEDAEASPGRKRTLR